MSLKGYWLGGLLLAVTAMSSANFLILLALTGLGLSYHPEFTWAYILAGTLALPFIFSPVYVGYRVVMEDANQRVARRWVRPGGTALAYAFLLTGGYLVASDAGDWFVYFPTALSGALLLSVIVLSPR
ncbi:MAG TPA: hypothetical protein VGN98_10980 [Tianweitania sediminis]|nr:hypothetical protein [Tianweitania sediminis]